ncbi:hypothetical protein [Streptomyces sp. NPDC021020]|uniref:hypothetical protein n=1 Tax=Streptomyces sp. NPDC021020 TaxID=3365109 RepID=UPI003788F79E
MTMRRSLAMLAAAVLAACGAQLGTAAAAHAVNLDNFGFDAPWGGGKQPQTLPQDYDSGHSFQLTRRGETNTTPAPLNVLLMYTLGAPKLDGTDVPDIPAGFTSTLEEGSCLPAAAAATGSGTAAFLCDMDVLGQVPYASFGEHIGADTPDGSVIGVTATIVPHKDDTLAKIQKAQRAGKHFTSTTDLTAVESQARAAQDSVDVQPTDFGAGQTATERVAVHAADNGTVPLRASSATPGEVWTDPDASWSDGSQNIFLPPGLNVTAVTGDGGAQCTLVPVEYQNTYNNYSANTSTLATCAVTPQTTAITLTFTAAPDLPPTAVELTADYRAFDNTMTPITSSSADFTVGPAL